MRTASLWTLLAALLAAARPAAAQAPPGPLAEALAPAVSTAPAPAREAERRRRASAAAVLEKEAPRVAAPAVAAFLAEELGPVFDGSGRLRDAVIATPVAAAAPPPKGREAPPARGYDYGAMFDLIRRTLAGPQGPRVRAFLRQAFRPELTLTPEEQRRHGLPSRLKDVSTSQLMLILQNNPHVAPIIEAYLGEMSVLKPGSAQEKEARKRWRAAFRGLLAEARVNEEFRRLNDPLEPMPLTLPGNAPGYRGAQVFLDHPSYRDGAWREPQDLVRVVLDFVRGAEKELMLNVFDFDLAEVADALVAKAASGVKVTVGIDKDVIAQRKDVKAVFDKLKAAPSVDAVAVDAVGLNHQKMMVRDWSEPRKAKVLFSSGNLTRSCLSPGGDLGGSGLAAKDSVPNANHIITLESQPAAVTVADSLIKTLAPEYRLRGNQYPLGGGFQVFGGGPAGPDTSFMALTFSPRGGLGEVNRDIVRRVLLQTRGPVRMLQFAFSSSEVLDALLERARLEKSEGNEFDFKSVGDTAFAMAGWSAFLRLSGYELHEGPEGKRYRALKSNPLRELLGKEKYEALKKGIRVAPPQYRKHRLAGPKGEIEYDAKLHHKVLISGGVAIAGTSFNFSESAEGNNEQMIVFRDPEIVAAMTAAFDGLYLQSRRSVEEEAERRNARFRRGSAEEPDPTPEDGSR